MSEEPNPPSHPPAWALDAVAAGDPPGPLESHLGVCDACRRYVESLRQEAEEFRAHADAKAFVAEVVARAATKSTGALRADRTAPRRLVRWGLVVAAPALAAAAAVALVAWPTRPPLVPVAGSELSSGEHFKGGLTVAVVRERAGRQDRLTAPFEVEPGDRIRVEVDVDR